MTSMFSRRTRILAGQFCILIVFSVNIITARAEEDDHQVWPLRYQFGDNLEWADIDCNDKDWRRLYDDSDEIETDSEYIWFRGEVLLSPDYEPYRELSIMLMMTATVEVYWNGINIENNCIEGDDITAANGKIIHKFRIPDSLVIARSNILALRAFKHKDDTFESFVLDIDSLNNHTLFHYFFCFVALFMTIIYTILTSYYFFRMRKEKLKKRFVAFAVVSGSLALQAFGYFWVFTFELQYSYFGFIESFSLIPAALISWMSPLYFAYEFNFPYKKTVWLGTSLAILCSLYFASNGFPLLLSGLIPSIIIILWAINAKRAGSMSAAFGILCIIAVVITGSMDHPMTLGFLVFAFFIMIESTRKIAQQKEEHVQSLLRSARLETELLRKVIQPHYILNSLNSLIEWLEQEPEEGTQLISALSEEFRILSRISNKKLITIADELKICRAHLEIMSYRKAINYSLRVENVNRFNKIPPAVFHTLIENGVTHNDKNGTRKKIEFLLSSEKVTNGIRYRLLSSGLPRSNDISEDNENHKLNSSASDDGIGFQYIKARLRESYGDKWKLCAGPEGGNWETVIEIYK